MQMFLMKVSQLLTGWSLMGEDTGITDATNTIQSGIINPIVSLLNWVLTPLLVLVGSAGAIYAIVLGVNYARAETSDKREEAKKRLINAVIGLVVIIVLLILLKLFVSNIDAIVSALGWGSTAA